MCFAQSRYRVCCFCPCYSKLLLQFKKQNVALTEDMKGNCLAYVACCSLELATESLQVYQQCKK